MSGSTHDARAELESRFAFRPLRREGRSPSRLLRHHRQPRLDWCLTPRVSDTLSTSETPRSRTGALAQPSANLDSRSARRRTGHSPSPGLGAWDQAREPHHGDDDRDQDRYDGVRDPAPRFGVLVVSLRRTLHSSQHRRTALTNNTSIDQRTPESMSGARASFGTLVPRMLAYLQIESCKT